MPLKPFLLATLLLGSIVALPLALPVAQADHSYLYWVQDWNYYISSDPHGKLNVIASISKLLRDHHSTVDWYFYHIQVQSVPGIVAYGSQWETSNHDGTHYPYNPVDYDPTTTDGFNTDTKYAEITIANEPEVTFGYSTTYHIPWLFVHDRSDYSQGLVRWHHDFNEPGDPAGGPSGSTFKVEPWFVVRRPQDWSSDALVWYAVQFGQWTSYSCWPWTCWHWEYFDIEGLDTYWPAQRSGDS